MTWSARTFLQHSVVLTTVAALLITGLLGPVLHEHEGCCAVPAAAELRDLPAPAGSAELCKCAHHAQPKQPREKKCTGEKVPGNSEHGESCSICIVLGQFGLSLTSLDIQIRSELVARIELANESDQFAALPDLTARGPPGCLMHS